METKKDWIDIRYNGEFAPELSDFLFFLILKLRESDENQHFIDNDELNKKFADFSGPKELDALLTKLSTVSSGFRDNRQNLSYRFALFSDFVISENGFTVQVSPYFNQWFDLLLAEENMTQFYLETYINIGSRYAKEFFRKIARNQKEGGGVWKPSLEELYQTLDIPKGYNSTRLNQRVFNQLQKELVGKDKILESLEITAIKGGFKNLQVQRYEFDFRFLK